MSIKIRKYMYSVSKLDENYELDFLETPLSKMNLPTVKTITITGPLEFRPDLVSLRAFGNYHMGWLIAIHNDLLDPINDFYIGREIKIPDLDEYYRFYNANSRSR